MNNEELDELQRCAVAYQKMIDDNVMYQVKIFSEKSIADFEIKNTPFEFQHLTAVHEKKMRDIWEVNNLPRLSSKNFLSEILDNYFSYQNVEKSGFYFDDINKPEDMTDEEFENAKATAKNKHKMFKSSLLDRLSALENLYSIMQHAGFEETGSDFVLKIYKWDRTARKEERPHDSTIEADYLLEFFDKNNPDKPFVDFFIIENKKGCYNGASIFRSPFTYSCDTNEEKAIRKDVALKNHRTPPSDRNIPEIKILSVTETRENSADKTVIMAKSNEYIQQCQDEINEHQQIILKVIANDPNKKERTAFFSKLGNHRSQFIKKDSRLNKENYCKMVEIDLFSYNFSEFDLKSLKSSMEQSLDAPNTSEKKRACLKYEIAAVETIIELKKMINELEQLLNQENFSIDAYADKLSSVSAYLADRSVNVGKDLVLKVAELIEWQKESCDEFTAELIDEEVKDMKRTAEQKPEDRISFGQSGGFRTAQFHTSVFAAQDNAMSLTMPFEAILNGIADSFNQLQETVIEKIHDFVNRVRQTADRIMNTVSATFHKKQEQNTEEPSVSAPETENENTENKDTEKDSNNDSHYIIMDGAGIQSYGSYFTIVSASELDFQVPLTYEIQQQHEKQQVKQEVSEEKSPAPEHRKKQAEYDDF